VNPLLSLSALSTPLLSASTIGALAPTEVLPFLQDVAKRFSTPEELSDVLSGVIRQLLFHPSLAQREGLAGADPGWRRVIAGLECLVSVKGVPEVITSMPEWCPEHATAANIETSSLMGPLLRLGVVERDWVRPFLPRYS
jgi:ubiquitin conjugation factor E4 B